MALLLWLLSQLELRTGVLWLALDPSKHSSVAIFTYALSMATLEFLAEDEIR